MRFAERAGLLATTVGGALLFAVACYEDVGTGVLEDGVPGPMGSRSATGIGGAGGTLSALDGGAGGTVGGGLGGGAGGTVSGAFGGGAGGTGGNALGGAGGRLGTAGSGGALGLGGTLGPGAGGTAGTSAAAAGVAGLVNAPLGTWSEFETFITGTCATSTACHGTGAKRAVLRGTELYDTLITYAVAKCENKILIVPGALANSAIYGTLTGACGKLIMPPACAPDPPCGPATNITITEAWIKNGAPGP